MTSILNINTICLQCEASEQQDVFEKIGQVAVDNGIAISKEEVIKGLQNREKESTTGFMEGFAIPHTKSEAISRPAVVIVSLQNGIEWESMDGEPTKFIISLLIPESEAGTTHLSLLSSISRMLMHADVRQKLLQANDAQAVLSELEKAL